MKNESVIAFFLLLSDGVLLVVLGGILKKLYGFDPPYFVFWTGLFMQPIGILCIAAAPVFLVVRLVQHRRKSTVRS